VSRNGVTGYSNARGLPALVTPITPASFEPHFTPQELAEIWQLDANTVRRLFQDVPGVLKIGSSNPRGKRGYVTLRIPQSVVDRVYRERSR
jgi:hypothetical protein